MGVGTIKKKSFSAEEDGGEYFEAAVWMGGDFTEGEESNAPNWQRHLWTVKRLYGHMYG